MSDQVEFALRRGPRLSRRTLLSGAVAAGAARLLPGLAAADPLWSVYATTVWDRPVTMRTVASYSKGDDAAVVPPGSSVRLVVGPDANGWYQVEWAGQQTTTGWLHGDRLLFTQTARVTWDAGVFAGAGDWTAWVGSLRRGYVVELISAPTDAYVLVRSGGTVGWTSLAALETSTQAATDPTAEQWIDVNRSAVQVNLMLGATVLDTFDARMSTETGDGFKSTAVGSWRIYSKVEGLSYTEFAKAYIMYWAGFDPGRFNGFHSWTMDAGGNVIGTGNTWGCVATAPEDAAKIYEFSWLGQRVEVHW